MTIKRIQFVSRVAAPVVEVRNDIGDLLQVPCQVVQKRAGGETLWSATIKARVPARQWQFRVCLENGRYFPSDGDFYTTHLSSLWVQKGQLYDYRPDSLVSPSRVIKIEAFEGSIPTRDLYIYLPRGYNEHVNRYYPVLMMHDGQNCFESFILDSYIGSWKADRVADRLISQGLMKECLIVGVSHGYRRRTVEYLPPYVRYQPPLPSQARKAEQEGRKLRGHFTQGLADKTADYYRDEVLPYIVRHYRALPGRDNVATCGSSMGGIFSTYLAWEHNDFARHHAALSPSYWISRSPGGRLRTVEKMRACPAQDIRFWLDSGTQSIMGGDGDDGMFEAMAARDALLDSHYVEGLDFQYYLDAQGSHSEGSWARRLDKVFQFLFPPDR